VLGRITRIMEGGIGVTDLACRVNGDQFILCSQTVSSSATRICWQLLDAVASDTLVFNGTGYGVGASNGITNITCHQPCRLSSLALTLFHRQGGCGLLRVRSEGRDGLQDYRAPREGAWLRR